MRIQEIINEINAYWDAWSLYEPIHEKNQRKVAVQVWIDVLNETLVNLDEPTINSIDEIRDIETMPSGDVVFNCWGDGDNDWEIRIPKIVMDADEPVKVARDTMRHKMIRGYQNEIERFERNIEHLKKKIEEWSEDGV